MTLRIGFSGALRPVRGLRRAAAERHGVRREEDQRQGRRQRIHGRDRRPRTTRATRRRPATTTQELIDDGIKVFVLTTADVGRARASWSPRPAASSSVGANTAPADRQGRRRPRVHVRLRRQRAGGGGRRVRLRAGLQERWLIGSQEIPYTKFIPQYFKEAFEQRCGGNDRGRGHLQDRADRFRTQVDEDPERRPGSPT